MRIHQRCERCSCRRSNQVANANLDAVRTTQRDGELHRAERRAAHLKEAVVSADVFSPKELTEQFEDGELARTRYMSYLELLVEAAPDDFGGDDEVLPDEDE